MEEMEADKAFSCVFCAFTAISKGKSDKTFKREIEQHREKHRELFFHCAPCLRSGKSQEGGGTCILFPSLQDLDFHARLRHHDANQTNVAVLPKDVRAAQCLLCEKHMWGLSAKVSSQVNNRSFVIFVPTCRRKWQST